MNHCILTIASEFPGKMFLVSYNNINFPNKQMTKNIEKVINFNILCNISLFLQIKWRFLLYKHSMQSENFHYEAVLQ